MKKVPENSTHPLTREAWRDWLSKNHEQSQGVWMISFKKATGKAFVSYNDAVEEALCFGWIDSKPNKLDAERSMLYFAPRKTGSGWSRPNKERIERMLTANKMMPSGLEKLAAAKQDRSWSKLDDVENLVVPKDLEQALTTFEHAKANWEAFPRSAKRGILEWILNAKRPETRAKRILETASLAEQNIRANQWPKS